MNDPLAQLEESRRWSRQPHPVPVVAAFIRRQEAAGPACLFIRRIKPPFAGQWALVGGKWDFGESLAGAVTREVREETGVQAAFVAFWGCVNERLFPQTPADLGAHFLIFVCELDISGAEPLEQAEGQVAWFTESQLDDLYARHEIAPTDYWIVKQVLSASQPVPYSEAEVVTRGTAMSAGRSRGFSASE